MQESKDEGKILKLAYIVPSLRNAGPVVVVRDLVHLMQKRGHSCKVYYFDPICELSFDCQVEQLSMSKKFAMQDFDIVHTHGFRPDLYVFLHKPLKTKTVFVTSMHNYLFKDFRYTYGRFKGFFYACLYLIAMSRADLLVALSKDAQKYYSRFKSAKKCTYVYNTANCNCLNTLSEAEEAEFNLFKSNSGSNSGSNSNSDYVIGGIGCLTYRKAYDRILKALKYLPNAKLCIVGEGEFKSELIKMAEDLGLKNRVLFVGYKQDAYRYIPKFDICVMPSRSEGFPLFLLESASFGKPVVTSDLPVFTETFSDGGIVQFKGDDSKAISIAIQKAYDEKETLSLQIRQRFQERYSPEVFAENYQKIYLDLFDPN